MFFQAIKSLPLWLLSTAAVATTATAAAFEPPARHDIRNPSLSHPTAAAVTTAVNTSFPTKYAAVIFPAFLMQDMIAVIDPIQLLAISTSHLDLYILAETMEPVSPQPVSMNPMNSSFYPQMLPTHTFATAPSDIEVLIVPGGPGVRNPDVSAVTDFIAATYPKLKYLVTVCTGAGLAAQAGVLDGRRATTNKASWDEITAMGPDVDWVSPARWVVDGNIWSSSGVMAGMDLTFAFIEHVWNASESTRVAQMFEYERHSQTWDPFAEMEGVPPQGSI